MQNLFDVVEEELSENNGTCEEMAKAVVPMVLRGICPDNAILFKVVPAQSSAPGQEGQGFKGYEIKVIGGAVEILSFSLGDAKMTTALSELASDFDQCMTPGAALIAYGQALDMVLARAGFEARVLEMRRDKGDDD